MTTKELAFIFSRAMAVYLFIGMLNVVPMNVITAVRFGSTQDQIWSIAPLVLLTAGYAALVLWLWLKADWLADLMLDVVPQSKSTGEETEIDSAGILGIGVSLIGVYVVSEAFPKATNAIVLVAARNEAEMLSDWWPSLVASCVTLGVQLGLGFWLMFGTKHLTGLIGRAREAGVARASQDER